MAAAGVDRKLFIPYSSLAPVATIGRLAAADALTSLRMGN